jgi:S-DNA-T family DNA segregation ATPase FtsK/SpoIIIE
MSLNRTQTRDRGPDRVYQDILAICLGTFGVLLLVSLAFGTRDDYGYLPRAIASFLYLLFGVGAAGVAIVAFLFAGFYAVEQPPKAMPRTIAGVIVLYVVILTGIHLQVDRSVEFAPDYLRAGGGYLGAAVAFVLRRALGMTASYIVLSGATLSAIILLTRATMQEMVEGAGRGIGGAARKATTVARQRREARATRRAENPREEARARVRSIEERKGNSRRRGGPVVELDADDDPAAVPEPISGDEALLAASAEVAEAPATPAVSPAIPTAPLAEAAIARKARPRAKANGNSQLPLIEKTDLYSPPPLSLLTDFAEQEQTTAQQDKIADDIFKLEDTLRSFKIEAKVAHYECGPVLTRYEVEPERGIRVSQVTNLADNLALALAAVDVRIEAPIPGKSAIGIEVPNKHRAMVSLKGILSSEAYRSHQSKTAVGLGADIAGKPVVTDLASAPHLLIAGATGSGKSVCLHSAIVSILMRARPDEVQFIIIDPKRVELSIYDGIPHLMAPVVYSVKQAGDVLRKAIREMEKRYDKFALKGATNLAEYNALATMPKDHPADEFDPLPRVVIVIDELADLMMQSRNEFEFAICRIAQLARATGIHLLVATQRPSVKIITGNIKANIPTRIALSVAARVDSMTILDGQGAERLIGRGDMLYSSFDSPKPLRIQGAFIPRSDIEKLVEHLRDQGEPQFSIQPELPADEEDFTSEAEASDELYAAAAQYVISEQQASVSMLQRHFKVGYARAGRLIDLLEQRGVIGPHEGSKPRQVIIGAGNAAAYLESIQPHRTSGDPIEQMEELQDLLAAENYLNEDIGEGGEEEYPFYEDDDMKEPAK